MEIQVIKDIFAKNLKYFRTHRQLSQSQLAEKADISITFLSNIERGKMFPKVETLSRLTKDMTKNVNRVMSEVFKLYSN
jgi:transcriptional regulator with XRE-family HTH domain